MLFRSKDFPGTLLRTVEGALATHRQGRANVTFDFWDQFDEAEEIEELRKDRPSLYHALPAPGARTMG